MLTTREVVGKTTPSKHETSYGVQYRNLCLTGPDVKYDTHRTFADDSDERLRSHFQFLKSILSTHPDKVIRDLGGAPLAQCARSVGTVQLVGRLAVLETHTL